MNVTILGSGTSSGVPMIGCDCPVCKSSDPHNRRMRASAAVELRGKVLLIDTSTDLREQALRFDLRRVDAVLYSHAHADHIHGIDELRVFNMRHLHEIPCYGNADTVRRIKSYFEYIFDSGEKKGFRPFLSLNEIEGPLTLFGATIVPIPLWHGELPVLGYRLGGLAYLTDVNRIPDSSIELLADLDLLVLDALRPKPHVTHFSIDQAVEVATMLKPEKTVLTHLSHLVDHRTTNQNLPKGVELAYDGMQFELDDPAGYRE